MQGRKTIYLLLAVLMGISSFATPALSSDRPHGSPAAPKTVTADDWREEYAYTLGVQAAVFTYPWLYFAHLRYEWMAREKPAGYKGIDMPLNQFYHFRNTVDASYRAGGSPNNDTLYSLLFLDVGKEPVILSHPYMGGRYFTFEIASMTSDNFAYVGKRTTGGYKKANDGSLTLYIQNESPGKDKESNWLPSPESGSFFMVFRTYMPSKEIVDQTWQIPGLVKVK